jgi:hypothetical protein
MKTGRKAAPKKESGMRYVLLYMGDEMALANLSPAELDRIVTAKTAVGKELYAQGKMVVGHRLWPTAAAVRVVRTGDRVLTVEGPFAETKEVVGGLDVIECASREEAIAWARRYTLRDGVTEVRPVWQRCLCHGSFHCSSPI